MIVAVIIPFYQRREGILRRALESVLRQELAAEVKVDIIVVDDGSPISLQGEIDGLKFSDHVRLRFVVQENAGVSAARNKALDNVDPTTKYVAFLDSDDVWEKTYLANAIEALNKSFDFYFCDSIRLQGEKSGFEQKSFENYLSLPAVKPLGNDLYALEAKSFFALALRGRMFGIQAVVYRYSLAPDLRFDRSLTVSGEDCLFIFQLLQRSQRNCCSTKREVTLGDGVNIYAGKEGWDNPKNRAQFMGLLLATYQWRNKLSLAENDDRFLRQRITRLRRMFAFLTLRFFLKYHDVWPAELRRLVNSDRNFWFWYPLSIIYVLVMRPLKLFNPIANW